MSTDDLAGWLAALGGHDRDAADVSVEGRALRAQLRAQAEGAPPAVADVDSAREAQLIARARAAGILPARMPARWRSPRSALMAATLAGIAIGVATLQYTRVPPETFRGTANGVVELEARRPNDLQERLIQELHDAGVHVTGYERLDRVGLDADLPLPVTPAVRRVLDRHHIPVPNDGALVVEIRAPEVR